MPTVTSNYGWSECQLTGWKSRLQQTHDEEERLWGIALGRAGQAAVQASQEESYSHSIRVMQRGWYQYAVKPCSE